LIVALLLAGVALAWGQRLSTAARPLPAPEGTTTPGAETYVYFLDVEGWYRVTPYETVVRSPYDLRAETTEAMAAALPATVGRWQQAGPDRYVGDDPAVVYYLKNPTVALERTYRDETGRALTLVLIGNKGADSFLLFSHTPETCYPGRLWQVVDSRRESAVLETAAPNSGPEPQPMYAQYLLTRQAQTGERLMVLYWYLWPDPRRNSQDGVLSVRVNLFLLPGETEEAALERAWDFVRQLFPSTIPWERF
jgi:hypothetical protein